jgi:uncharacterized protein involved in response to NO
VETAGYLLLGALPLLHLLGIGGAPLGVVLVGLALVQALRLAGWHDRRVWGVPILWVLYTGYGWLALGFLAEGLAALGRFPPSAATHALTAGAVGVLTLGMMARVALGHTGRPMRSAVAVDGAFVLANLAAGVRVLGPWLWPAWYPGWILLAGLLWVLAFAVFTLVYAPILLRPRVDGAAG